MYDRTSEIGHGLTAHSAQVADRRALAGDPQDRGEPDRFPEHVPIAGHRGRAGDRRLDAAQRQGGRQQPAGCGAQSAGSNGGAGACRADQPRVRGEPIGRACRPNML
ncbi:hypothetical protein ACFPRL_20325 [Pseudoclavibacter helvolus]